MTTTKPTMVFAFDGKRVARVEETRPEEELCRFGKKGGVFPRGRKALAAKIVITRGRLWPAPRRAGEMGGGG